MKKARTMTTAAIYQKLNEAGCNARRADHLVHLFHLAAIFLVNKIEKDGWKWRDNYLREHAGCAFGAVFTNTISPYINELLFRQFPEYRKYEDPGEADRLL